MRMGVLNGTIPSAVSDTGATSSAFLREDPSIPTGRTSSAIFHLPNGAVAPATTINKLLHNVRAPARDVNIVPSLVGNSLLSTSKFTDAGYTVIGHGIVGKDIPIMARLAEARRWSKR